MLFLVYVSDCPSILHILDYHSYLSIEISRLTPHTLFIFFFQIVLASLVPLHFHVEFRISSMLLCLQDYRMCQIFIINLERIAVFTMFSFLIHEHCMSLHLFRSSLIFFSISILQFIAYISWTCFVGFTFNYFLF